MIWKWVTFLLVGLLTGLALVFELPWWMTVLVGFIIVLLLWKKEGKGSFWIPGLAAGIIWMALTMKADLPNHQILGNRMASLFHLPSSYFLWIIEGLIGFVSAGLGGRLAYSFKSLRTKDK